MEGFEIFAGLDRLGHTTIGKGITFRILFPYFDASGKFIIPRNSTIGSVSIDYGDGTVEDTGLQTFDPPVSPFELGASKVFTHAYTKLGTFTASVKGGRVQPCAIKPGLAAIPVNVVDPYQVKATERASLADPHGLFIPGKIARAGMVEGPGSGYWNVQIEGSGRCSLKVFEELGGTALHQYDYNGPLPTKIYIIPTEPYDGPNYRSVRVAHGTHALKIEGNKSSDGCAGTASVSFTIQVPGRAKKK